MNGILCIDKPRDFTSFDVVAKTRGIAKTRKIGHGGTLDPMATGVLPLFIGVATKACDLVPDHDKRYTASFQLGVTTDTQDCTGSVLTRSQVAVSTGQVTEALGRFLGEIDQVPPMYSAVKIGGKRLYDLARQGVEVERPSRRITIRSLELQAGDEQAGEYTVDVLCSKGTYIRTLCHDVGQLLGCGAVLTSLRRTMACGYTLEDCCTLEQAQQWADEGGLAQRLAPVESAFAALPRLKLTERQTAGFCNGVRIPLEELALPDRREDLVAVFGQDRFLGVAVADLERGLLVSRKLFAR